MQDNDSKHSNLPQQKSRLSRSLRFRLLVMFFGLTVGPILIIALISGRASYESFKAQQLDLFEQIAMSIEYRVLAIFDQAERDFWFLENNGIAQSGFQSQREQLQSLVLGSSLYQSASLVSIENSTITQASRTSVKLPGLFEELISSKLFVDTIRSKRSQVEVLFDATLHESIARLTLPIINPRNGRVSDILFAELRLKSVRDTLVSVVLEQGREAYVIDDVGRVVAHQNPSIVLRGTVIGNRNSEFSKGLSGKVSVIHSNSGKLAKLGLQVVVEQPVEQAYQLIRDVLIDVIFISCIALLLAYVTWLYFNNKIVVPLNQLSKAAKNMSEGKYPKPLDETDVDELNILLSSFNEMVVDLKQAQLRDKKQATELAKMHTELEGEYRVLELTERKLRKSQNLLKHAQQIAQLGNWEWDIQSDTFTWSNEIFTILELYGNEVGKGIDAIFARVDPQELSIAEKNWRTIPPKDKHIQWTNKLILKSGAEKYVTHRAEAIFDDNGSAVKVIGVMQDITTQRKNEIKIWHQAHYDFLTGLVNRSLFQDRLEQALIHAQRNESKVGLLFIDLDNFKMVNDTLGHNAGDLVLKEVATRLVNCVRKEDTVARLGGDEFTILLGDITDVEQLKGIVVKVHDSLSSPVSYNAQEISVSGSIGVAIYPDEAEDMNSLMRLADDAMYRAKYSGKKAN